MPRFNPQPKNKFGAKKQSYGGRTYDSKLEAEKAISLDWQKKQGEVLEVTPQYKLELCVNGVKVCNYYIDFRVVNADRVVDYIEIKGFPTDLWRLKFALTKALFDELTPGENARLFLNDKCVKQSFKA